MRRVVVIFHLLVICGLLIGSSVSGSVSAQAYESPHGPYGDFPAGCAACHTAHAGLGSKLITEINITTLCFGCHDGTASTFNVVYDVDSAYRDVYGYGFSCAGAVYFHPVLNTGNPLVGSVIECTNCHNPHSDLTVGGATYHRLLNSFDGTSRYYQGPDFCLACHGSVDRGFTSVKNASVSYYTYTLGNHRNTKAVHYNTSEPALQPVSGTLVTCAACHFKHASDQNRLLAKGEENLCFKCHNTTANSMSGRNIQDEFQSVTTASYHDIYGRTGAKIECSSCHGPHTVGAKSLSVADATYSQVANPDNTKSVMARVSATQDNGIANTVGTFTTFCLKCHDGSPPTAVADVYNYVPYSIVFPTGWRGSITTNSGGWNKSAYTGKGHDTRSILCSDCHKSHGSQYSVLQVYAEDTDTVSGECLVCHDGSFTGAADVKTYLTKAKRHPTLYTSGKHSDTENYDNMPLADRHAECVDCHDPHRCDNTGASAPDAWGSIKGVSGVAVNFGTGSLINWPGTATFTEKLGVDYQYELCFKCHSYYSYRTSPPSWPSRPAMGTETDQAQEFSPNNPGYHAVVGESKIPTFNYNGTDYYYGKFTGNDRNGNPLTATSRLYCTDCHRRAADGSPEGPHGSAQTSMLRGAWQRDADNRYTGTGGYLTDSSGHLCFFCHNRNFYDNYPSWDQGSVTVRSKFSGPQGGFQYNYHSAHDDIQCAACHSAIPHGHNRRGMLALDSDTDNRYSIASHLVQIPEPLPSPGNWRCTDCKSTSHHK
ncbi:MAG: cytochrome c3 family protein [Bacillota bacterium]